MFEIGDRVVYENDGICTIEEIGSLNMSSINKERIYYTLIPVYDKGAKIFIPTDAPGNLRLAMTEKDVHALLEKIPGIEPIEIMDEKRREQEYKAAIRSGDCQRVIQIIKTIYNRKKKRNEDGKKITEVDERYFKLAEDKIYGEIALALDIDKSQVLAYIKEYLEK